MTDQPSRPTPKRLADFEVLRRLGVGGMAEVFLAKKRGAEGTFKLLVVKRVLPAHGSSRRFRAMFAEEAQLATRLNHPNIVQVYEFQDYGEEGQLLSMEYVEGPDLRRLYRAAQSKGIRIPPFVGAYVVAEVGKGLHYAHERKDERGAPLEIVHRDVSPQNILLSFEGAVKIADFGIASANLFREELGVLKGKTGYMSPEQARGERVDRRTDVYSLGVVFHELLTGRPLHGPAEGQELLEAVRDGRVEAPSTFARDVPPELEVIVMRALARSPDERFQTARELGAAITRTLFQKQQLVDAQVLETVISQLVRREHIPAGLQQLPASVQESEAAERGASLEESDDFSDGVGRSDAWADEEATGAGHRRRALRERAGREVRHVAVVTLRIHGLDELCEATSKELGSHITEQLRSLLDEIAFKRGARWSWGRGAMAEYTTALGETARAVVGLLENPARAASDAAWLAVDVHEAVRNAAEDAPVKLAASVGVVRGIATGRRDAEGHLIRHVLKKPADYLAGLLGDQAPAGCTWVAGGLYRLVRRDFVWEEAPKIQIDDPVGRDLPGVMRIYSLVRPKTRQEKVEETALAPSDLVGRDAELADLQAAFHGSLSRDGAERGQMTARVVLGEMGIGKSALVSAFLAELPAEARVLRAECSPARMELPYASIADFIRDLTGTRASQPFGEIRDAVRAQLGATDAEQNVAEIAARFAEIVAGRVAPAADEGDAAHNRQIIAAGVRRFLATITEQGPLVLVVEGLQWSDRPSLETISDLLRGQAQLPVMFVLVTRPSDRVDDYLEGLVRIELKGLSAESQIRLVQAHLGATEGVAQVCADLLPRAAGNPYFLLEMVDALLERGTLELRERDDGKQQLLRIERAGEAALPLPSTLEQLIADRLHELPPEEHAIVEWLAVSGGPLSGRDLRTLTGSDSDDVVARLCARGVCDTKEDLVDVRYPLTRDVAYAALDRAARLRKHRALGEHLATTRLAKGLTAAIVARHLALGDARSEAADLFLEAAATARASFQVQLSNRYYRRALLLLAPDDPRRLEAHEALESSSRIQGRWRERRKHLAALRALARACQKPRWVAVALLRTAQLGLDEGHLASALTSTQQAEQVARRAGSAVAAVQAQSLMAEILRDLGDMQGALAACDRALETAAHPDVPAQLRAEVLRARGTLLVRVGRVNEAIDAYAEAIAVFKQAGARRHEARAKNSLAFALFVMGRFEDAIALALEAIKIDLAIGGRFQIARTLSTIGQSYARLGDLRRGLSYLRRAREAHERYGDQDSRAETLLCTAEVLIELGDLAGADSLVGDAGALTAVSGSAYDLVHEKILRAVLARSTGDCSTAVMHAFDARQGAEAQAYVAYHFYAMAVEAAARVDVGELHTGILLATTALGAIETIQGSEYGLETRAICCEAMRKARSPQADEMGRRAAEHVRLLAESIRDPAVRRAFLARPLVATLPGWLAQNGAAAQSFPFSSRSVSPADEKAP
jgi:serine/threonine protein kinase/tetratricopeptide (TPR) repeat protein